MRIAAVISFIVFCAFVSGCVKEKALTNAPMDQPTPSSSRTDGPDKPRIIAFGDSLTAGFGLADPKKSYPTLLQESLARDGFDYDVINLGSNGDTSAGGLKRLWLALKYANVRLFILELGANDIVKKTPPSEIRPNLSEIIKRAKASGAQIILCGYAAPRVLGDDYVSEIQQMYAALAKENDLPLIANYMQDVSGNAERMQDDGIHPNEKGVGIIEQNVRRVVETILTKNVTLNKRRRNRTWLAIAMVAAVTFFMSCSSLPLKTNRTSKDRPLVTPNTDTNKPKIIAFGDSLTAGFGLSEKESYPYLLQEKLKADGYDYEVVNAGISGDTSIGGLERSDWVLGQENARILILELGANDLLRGLPVAKMKENLDKIIHKAKAKNLKVLLCGMLAPPTMGAEYQRDFMMAFPDLASENKVAFLPFLLENVALKKELNQADSIHPNAEGEKIMADNIYKALKPLLRQ
jgi:acyl-CoA thioesterase-1